MGVGGAIFAILALIGLQIVLTSAPSLHKMLRIAGSLYLLFIAYKIWRSASEPLQVEVDGATGQPSISRSFLLGLVTQLSNPKTAIVYSSVFSAALSTTPSPALVSALSLTVFLIEFGWYSVVAVAFSTGPARQSYLRSKLWIDRLAAGAIGLLGVKIIVELRSD